MLLVSDKDADPARETRWPAGRSVDVDPDDLTRERSSWGSLRCLDLPRRCPSAEGVLPGELLLRLRLLECSLDLAGDVLLGALGLKETFLA